MKKAFALLALVLAAIALVACGDDDDDGDTAATTTPSGAAQGGGGGAGGGGGGGGGATTLKLSAPADGSLAFDTDQLNAKAGNITIEFDNPAAVSHNVEVESDSGELGVSDTIAQDTTTLQLTNVKPGTYEYYCNIPGHKEGGMDGTLTVK
jgi:plastocyanin